jgi:hypothetical protein
MKSILDIKIAVVIPWRSTPSRAPLANLVDLWYKENFSNAKIIYSDSDHERFSISAARNIGAKKVSSYDVIVHNDADVIPSFNSVVEGIFQTLETNLFSNPFTELRELTDSDTQKFLKNEISIDQAEHKKVPGSCSGVVITTPSSWKSVGGLDESFVGWGYEDAALAVAHRTILGQDFLAIPGVAYSMYHEPAEKNINLLQKNRNILQQYFDAEGDVKKMKSLIKSRGIR